MFYHNRSKTSNSNLEFEKTFLAYLNEAYTNISKKALSINVLKEPFFSMKDNQSADYDEISFNINKNCFAELH